MAEPSLELLQAMVQRVLDKQVDHDGTFAEMGARLTSIVRHLAGVRRDAVLDAETVTNVQAQVDALRSRLTRIERRLELVDGA